VKLHTWYKTNGGNIQTKRASATVEQHGSVSAVYANVLSREPLDADFGVGMDIDLECEVKGFMANYRHSEFWCSPFFGKELCDVPDETQALLYEREDGVFGVILPVVAKQYKCVLTGGEKLTARLFSWYGKLSACNDLAFVYSEGENPFELMEDCVKVALKLLNTGTRTREERVYPEIFEYLGWCSWDSMQIRVCEDGLIQKCNEFREKNIPVKWAILDDMWGEVHDFYCQEYSDFSEMVQLMHSSRLYSFEADPLRFPNGLKSCIDKIKEYGITVGMWHPTTGYWHGLEKNGKAYEQVKDYLIETADGWYIHDYKADKAYMFYKTFHDFLRRCGADFVKIDNQTMTRRFYKGLAPVGEVVREFHGGMEASAGEYFGSKVINCMGMGSEDMWNRQTSPISRCSDDFLPENKKWFKKHILQCAYNCYVQGQFYYCDWDMWWTDDGQAVKNSILRAISGGPIYVSDKIGRSHKNILEPLILSDGKILRCDRPAMPTMDCMTVDPLASENIFKLQNICDNGGVIAVFNLNDSNKAVSGSISPSDIQGIEGSEFVVYEHFSKTFKIIGKDEKIQITLKDEDDFKLYTVVPYLNGFAALGDVSKFVPLKTIKHTIGENIAMYDDAPCTIVKDGKLLVNNK
jgi:hypothetical protein